MSAAGAEALAALQTRLQHLEDVEAIRQLLRRIARGTDRFDGALLAESIHADAVLDLGGARPMSGADFAAVMKPPAAPRPGRMHIISNEQVEVDGDLARSETYLLSCQDLLVDGVRRTRIRAGRYLDRFARREGIWKLSARTMVDEWGRVDAVAEAIVPGPNTGRPAPDDLSYLG